MQSRQLNFYIHPDDLPEIELFLREEDALFIRQPTFDMAELYGDSIAFDDQYNFASVFLVKSGHADRVVTQWIAAQGYWLVDDQSSWAIQFSRGGFSKDGKNLNRARFYYTSFYYHEGERIEKPKEFVAWTDRLKRKFKKRFMVPGAGMKGTYYSRRIESLMQQLHRNVLDTSSNQKRRSTALAVGRRSASRLQIHDFNGCENSHWRQMRLVQSRD